MLVSANLPTWQSNIRLALEFLIGRKKVRIFGDSQIKKAPTPVEGKELIKGESKSALVYSQSHHRPRAEAR